MKNANLASVLALAASVASWEIQIFDNNDCDVNNPPNDYYIYTGSGPSYCITLQDTTTNGVTCGYYTNGGDQGPLSCEGTQTGASGPFASGGSYIVESGSTCTAYGSTACGSEPEGGQNYHNCTQQGIVSFTCNDS